MFFEHINNKDFIALQENVFSKMNEIAKYIISDIREDEDISITESRFRVVNRVRGGKIQRRKKVSNVKGYRMHNGRLVRMTPQEKLKRIRGQRKAKLKRKAKLSRSLQRRRISIRKRGNL